MLRIFSDANGTTWKVWDVYPSTGRLGAGASRGPSDAPLTPFPARELTDGWLCFESDSEKRRLAPIPPDWETCETCVLEELCGRAGFVTRLTPPSGPSAGARD